MKIRIKKWNDICVFTSIISKMTEQIDCQWSNMFQMHLSQSQRKYFHFSLIMTSSLEWVLILISHSMKTRSKNAFKDSKIERSSSLWRKFERSSKNTWKRINEINSHMRIDIKSSRQIIKLKIRYNFLLRTFKQIDHQENSITKCSNRSRFWKKRKFLQAWFVRRNEYSFDISYLIITKEFRRFFVKTIHSFIIISRDKRRARIRRREHNWFTISKKNS
jgi:hypothetical protein